DPGPRRDERQAHGRSGPTRGSIPARRGQRMGRIGDGRDGGCLGRLVQAHGEGKLRRRAIGVLEADHRAPGVERGDPRREERAETLVEIGPAERRGDASGKGLERRGSIDGSWHGVLQSSGTQGSRVSGTRSGRGIVHRVAAGSGGAILRSVKLLVAIVHHEDAGALVDALLDREYRATRLASSGGFLKQLNATVILGVDDDQVETVLEIVRETCHARTQVVNPMPPIMEPGEFFMPYPLEVEVGGATVFVLPVERYERI